MQSRIFTSQLQDSCHSQDPSDTRQLRQRGKSREISIDVVEEGDEEIEERAADDHEIELVPGVVEVGLAISYQLQDTFTQEYEGEDVA